MKLEKNDPDEILRQVKATQEKGVIKMEVDETTLPLPFYGFRFGKSLIVVPLFVTKKYLEDGNLAEFVCIDGYAQFRDGIEIRNKDPTLWTCIADATKKYVYRMGGAESVPKPEPTERLTQTRDNLMAIEVNKTVEEYLRRNRFEFEGGLVSIPSWLTAEYIRGGHPIEYIYRREDGACLSDDFESDVGKRVTVAVKEFVYKRDETSVQTLYQEWEKIRNILGGPAGDVIKSLGVATRTGYENPNRQDINELIKEQLNKVQFEFEGGLVLIPSWITKKSIEEGNPIKFSYKKGSMETMWMDDFDADADLRKRITDAAKEFVFKRDSTQQPPMVPIHNVVEQPHQESFWETVSRLRLKLKPELKKDKEPEFVTLFQEMMKVRIWADLNLPEKIWFNLGEKGSMRILLKPDAKATTSSILYGEGYIERELLSFIFEALEQAKAKNDEEKRTSNVG